MISLESPVTLSPRELDDLQELALRRTEAHPATTKQKHPPSGCGRNLKIDRNRVTVTGPHDS